MDEYISREGNNDNLPGLEGESSRLMNELIQSFKESAKGSSKLREKNEEYLKSELSSIYSSIKFDYMSRINEQKNEKMNTQIRKMAIQAKNDKEEINRMKTEMERMKKLARKRRRGWLRRIVEFLF